MKNREKKNGKKGVKILTGIVSFLAAAVITVLVLFGWKFYAGPFKGLSANRIQAAYKGRPEGEIVFYGASNFTFWDNMEADMLPYVVQNHGFGGSKDEDLMKYAEKLLYPYKPSVVFFQTGSNDLNSGITIEQVIGNKDRMYSTFRKELPDTLFIVMSALPLPGRAELWEESRQTNEYLKEYCSRHEDMLFLDATDLMLTKDGGFKPEYFKTDGIHLNENGQKVWCSLMKETLETLFKEDTK